MKLLGIETSCDETSAAIIEGQTTHITVLSQVIASSLATHAKTGGIIPENAAREQVQYMLPVIQKAITDANITLFDIDGIAITYGPGLIGSLLVGVETAKTLSYVLNKPIIPINHMVGHIYANWIRNGEGRTETGELDEIQFPLLALVVSGGHTDLLIMKEHGDFQLLGGTRDDAAGEAFDKIGRLLGLNYPAGPRIEELAHKGNPKRFQFPRPLIGSPDYDFSFSGLKTAVLREVMKLRHPERSEGSPEPVRDSSLAAQNDKSLDSQTIADIARATQDAISAVLVKKTLKAARTHGISSILLSGGVAANNTLREQFARALQQEKIAATLFVPSPKFCTDSAAMIASAAYFNFHPVPWKEITADPELYFDQ